MTPAEYDAWYDSPRGHWIGDTEWREVCRNLDRTPGTRVLDVGCGTGWFTRQLAATGLQVTGLDIDPVALAFAREHSPSGIDFIEGDARCLPFANGAFKQTVALTSLGFMSDWSRAITEIIRVTRSRLVLGLLNRHSLLWLSKGRNRGSGGYAGAHWRTRREVLRLLATMQVRNVRTRSAVFIASGTAVARRVERITPGWLPWGAFLVVSGEIVEPVDTGRSACSP